jgi:hypothetical protein
MPNSTKSFNYSRIIVAGSCVPCEARVKYLTVQHNRLGINFFSIQKCNCGIRPIRGKMRSTVWTVYRPIFILCFLCFTDTLYLFVLSL